MGSSAKDALSDIDEATQVEVVQADLSRREGVHKVYDSIKALPEKPRSRIQRKLPKRRKQR